MTRVIVCGSRHWSNATWISDVLSEFVESRDDQTTVIHGDAKGADRIAGSCARRLGLRVEAYPADWETWGKRAGVIRNRQMLDAGADFVIAFKENLDQSLRRGGTENMIRIARAAGVPVIIHGGDQ